MYEANWNPSANGLKTTSEADHENRAPRQWVMLLAEKSPNTTVGANIRASSAVRPRAFAERPYG